MFYEPQLKRDDEKAHTRPGTARRDAEPPRRVASGPSHSDITSFEALSVEPMSCSCAPYRSLVAESANIAKLRDQMLQAAARGGAASSAPMWGCDIPQVPGLRLMYNVMTAQEESDAVAFMADDTTRSPAGNLHAASQWGWVFHSCRREMTTSRDKLTPVPRWLLDVVARARAADPQRRWMPVDEDWGAGVQHALVNTYAPGDGIKAHVDDEHFWTTWVLGLSLGSACVMHFDECWCWPRRKELVALPPRSLYVLTGDARYRWRHGIEHRFTDNYDGIPQTRGARLSITLRGICDKWLPREWRAEMDTDGQGRRHHA